MSKITRHTVDFSVHLTVEVEEFEDGSVEQRIAKSNFCARTKVPGMIVQGETRDEALHEIIKSLRVKIQYDHSYDHGL